MKKILALALVCQVLVQSLNAAQIKHNLLEFANIVSATNNVQILVSGDLTPNNYYFFSNYANVSISLNMFKKMVELQGLRFLKMDDFYFIDDPQKNISLDQNSTLDLAALEPENLYYVKMNNNSFNELNAMLGHYDKNATFIAQDNSAVFKATEKQYSEIISYLPNFDNKVSDQVSFKITILETDLSDLKNRGTEINSLLKIVDSVDFRYFFNLVTVPYLESSNVINQSDKFYGVLNFLDENQITRIKSSPFLVAKNNEQVFFSSVKTVPFMVNTSTYNNYSTQSQNTYEYKDVGLTLKLRPVVVGDNIDVDLDLKFENLIDTTKTLTPSTSKKELRSNYRLKRGQIIVLSGINQDREVNIRKGIPLLKDIWLLKYLFGTDSKDITNSILTISIEVLDEIDTIDKSLSTTSDANFTSPLIGGVK